MLPPGSHPSNCSTQRTFEKLLRHEELPPMQVPVRKLCFVGLPGFLWLWPNPPSMKVEVSWQIMTCDWHRHTYTTWVSDVRFFFFWCMTEAFAAMGSSDLPTSLNIDEYGMATWFENFRANLDAAKTWNGLHALCLKDEYRVRARPSDQSGIVLVMICRCIEAAASHKEQSPRFAPISIAWTLKSRTLPADLLAGFI